jgi:septal ring factor EnvC (AmiA/AmiB activator)
LQQTRRPEAELARAQQQLATRMEMLAEVLDALRRNASTESPVLRRQLDTAAAETPPAQIAAAMRQAARQLASGPSPQAAQGAAEARDDLRQLAQALGGARGAFAQPQLQELLALEEQLAQLLQQIARGDEARAAELQRKWQDLAAKLDRLAAADRRLAQALDKSPTVGKDGSPSQSPNGSSTGSETPTQAGGTNPPAPGANPRPGKQVPNGSRIVTPGHYEWITQRNIDGIRDVARVLQTRIQEAILAGALLDSDQPVPPEYKPLVEKYYKTLSDDLR